MGTGMLSTQKIAVVTGANKGIGLAIVSGLLSRYKGQVYLTARDDGRGQAAVAGLKAAGLDPLYHQLDVTDKASVTKFCDHLQKQHGGIDILVNNAAVVDVNDPHNRYEDSKYVIDVNYRSLLTIQEHMFPLVRNHGRILNISSDCGHLSNLRNNYWIERLSKKDITVNDVNEFVDWYLESVKNGTFQKNDFADQGTIAAYRVSKIGVSALTIIQQRELEERNISVNSLHPGLVQTDMTSGVGFYTPDKAAKIPLYLLLEAPPDLRGAYVWFNGKVLDWYDYKADYYFKSKTLLQKYETKP